MNLEMELMFPTSQGKVLLVVSIIQELNRSPFIHYAFYCLADMPSFMGGDRIVGGAVAPSMIPWQVALLSGNFQFCGGTVLNECTVLSAAHCGITTSKSIRAGSLIKNSGGQVNI